MTAQELAAIGAVMREMGMSHVKTADFDVAMASTVKRAKPPVRRTAPQPGAVDAMTLALQLAGRGAEDDEDGA